MKHRRSHNSFWYSVCYQSDQFLLRYGFLLAMLLLLDCTFTLAKSCPPSEAIMPCRCSFREKEAQIWCSYSSLPQIMDGINAVDRFFKNPIDEFVLENNHLPSLPGRFFGSLQIVRLMLRYNGIERVSNGWLNELENSLLEIYVVEPQLRIVPAESLNRMINMIAITIQSDALKHLPDFSGMISLTYLSIQSASLIELLPYSLRHLPKIEDLHIIGGSNLNRIEADLINDLMSLKNIDFSHNGITWMHLRALNRLPNLNSLKLSSNQVSDAAMIGRIAKDLKKMKRLRLDHNIIKIIERGSFVDLPLLSELYLNDNQISEIQYGAFLRTPKLKALYLHNNRIRCIHPESFLQASGSGVEMVFMYNNEINQIGAISSLLDALPKLKFLDISNNYLVEMRFGQLRGHNTLEQLHMNNNLLRIIERDALTAMPTLRELRLRNNSLSQKLSLIFRNLTALKGLDLSSNIFRSVDPDFLVGLSSLRRLDLSENRISNVNFNTFIHSPMLETLNISSNELEKIHPTTFRNMDRLYEIDASFNQLKDIIPGLPKNVECVLLRGNLIRNLPVSASKSLNLPKLRILDLSFNQLTQLPKFSFKNVSQLRMLSMANNLIRTLEDTVFIGAQRLNILLLEDNEITEIDERAFLCLPGLRNLNLSSNKLEVITDNLFSNNSRIEKLDLSVNHIRLISPVSFDEQHSLEYLDLSGNQLLDISISLAMLKNLRDIDLSYNKISHVYSDIVSAWHSIIEIRLANNLIEELKQGTFSNLLNVQYLDLSSNYIASLEPSALKNLPNLKELVLADNKLIELKNFVFEGLPNLLTLHFQYNILNYISQESFHNSPSMIFLNLSNNDFHNMESIGLRGMRNLEVLDLSNNRIRTISTMPLKALNWLVELKIDRNYICKIEGAHFQTMPRLRVLSLRHNHLRTIKEQTFQNLRGNIAIFDVDGNPIHCNCETQWLSVWLQETNYPYPGPKCNNGRFLFNTYMNKRVCPGFFGTDERAGAGGARVLPNNEASNNLPLHNGNGNTFHSETVNGLGDECEYSEQIMRKRLFDDDSEYFNEQFIDLTPVSSNGNRSAAQPTQGFSTYNSMLNVPGDPAIILKSDLNHTILNTISFNKRPLEDYMSPLFIFFGYPIPGFLGTISGGRNDRSAESSGRSSVISHSRRSLAWPTSSAHIPAADGKHAIKAVSRAYKHRHRFHKYQPNTELERYASQEKRHRVGSRNDNAWNNDITARKHSVEVSLDSVVTRSEDFSTPYTKNVFRTILREPVNIENGGFHPFTPESVVSGDFRPLVYPYNSNKEGMGTKNAKDQPLTEVNIIPVATTSKLSNFIASLPNGKKHAEKKSYYNTEASTTKSRPVLSKDAVVSTRYSGPLPYTTSTPLSTKTAGLTVPEPQAFRMNEDHEQPRKADFNNFQEPDATEVPKPPTYVPTMTAETTLLIPPSDEYVVQIRCKFSTTVMPVAVDKQNPKIEITGNGRSIITQVHTPQTLNHFLTSAEEFHYRPTTLNSFSKSVQSDEIQIDATSSADTYKAETQQRVYLNSQFDDGPYEFDRIDSMEWYYEIFKKQIPQQNISAIESISGMPYFDDNGQNVGTFSNRVHITGELVIIFMSIITLHQRNRRL